MGKTGTQRQVCLLALEFAELESIKDKQMELSLAVNELNAEMMVKSIRSKARMDLQVISQR